MQMDFSTFIERLTIQLSHSLPGEEVQLIMAPETRLRYREYYSSIPNPKKSGVLICIYPKKGIAHTVLMLRPDKQGIHSGQVSFPGGRQDKQDTDLEATALREANEEIGIQKNDVVIIGKLTPLLIPVSSFHVEPFIGYLNYAPVFSLNKAEVMDVIEMEVQELLEERMVLRDEFLSGTGLKINAPYYLVAGHKVWGATAMMLRELEELLRAVYNLD